MLQGQQLREAVNGGGNETNASSGTVAVAPHGDDTQMPRLRSVDHLWRYIVIR
jgi:hypothetical protein